MATSAQPDAGGVDERLLAERLSAVGGDAAQVRALGAFVREARDAELVRINPVKFARARGWAAGEAVALFLRARKAGLMTMGWHVVCRGCGQVVEDFRSLNELGNHVFCRICVAARDVDMSHHIEIGFTVSKAVRATPFHDRDSLSAVEQEQFDVSASALAGDGRPMRDFYTEARLFADFVEPGETKRMRLMLAPGEVYFSYGQLLRVRADAPARALEATYTGGDAPPTVDAPPGPLDFAITNRTARRYRVSALAIPPTDIDLFDVRLADFLSGARLLSTQAFRDLFPSEIVMNAGGFAVARVALVFSDIQGSTALYERIGDLRAFDLVRQHFALLRDAITNHNGALVKTIGDAVMASFDDPLDAVRAARAMHAEIGRFNAAAGEDMLALKIGAHVGPSLAVTLNGQLDYFGQTVNKTARVQALAGAGEICLTQALFDLPGVDGLMAGLAFHERAAPIRGMSEAAPVRCYGAA